MKKLMIMILAGALVLSNFAFAAEATDVTQNNWAYTYVKQVVENDMMPLNENGAFGPHNLSTKMEVINVIYRMALLKNETTVKEVEGYLEEHQKTIDGLLIPQSMAPYGADNHRAIAYALERNIVRTSELSLFYTNGRFEPIKKVDASVYMAKALNVYLEQNVNKFYEIIYKDGGEITLMAWPYINLLIEENVVLAEGDNGYFYPNSTLNRDILSVLVSRVLRSLEGFEKVVDSEEVVHTFSISGRLSMIHYDKNIIEIRDQYENLKIYDVSETSFTLNDESINLENLESGMMVNLKSEGNKLISLSVVEEYNKFQATFKDVGVWITGKDETYTVVFFDKPSAIPYLKALKSVVVTRDFQKSSLDKIESGDKVIVSYEDGYVKKIESYSKKVVLDGVLQRSSDFKKDNAVSIKLSNEYMLEQTLKTDVVKTNATNGLLKGDVVKVTLSNGEIIAVENTGLTIEATGRLVGINIGETSSVTLINQKGLTKTYALSKILKVQNLDTVDPNGIYALRLDQDITLHLEGVLVNEIEINKAVEREEFQGTIKEVHGNINIIKALDSKDKTWIISLEGSDQNIGDYKVGDKIYVYGVALSVDLFEADLVIVLD